MQSQYDLHPIQNPEENQPNTTSKRDKEPSPNKFEAETTHRHDYQPYRISFSPSSNSISRKKPMSFADRHYEKDLLKSSYEVSYLPYSN